MERCKAVLTLLAVALIITAFPKSTLAAPGKELPWVKTPPTIEQLTHGKVHTGETITAQNLGLVRPYLLQSFARNIMNGGSITIIPTTPSSLLVPERIVKATMASAGLASISPDGTIRDKTGRTWKGFPFAKPKTALEVMADFQYDYHDSVFPKSDNFWISPRGVMYKHSQNVVEEYYMNGRACVPPYGVVPGYGKELTRQLLYYNAPYDLKGLAILSIIYTNQSKLPDSWGYVPVLRRVQRFSSAQRYDSADGSDLRAGDINTFSDPLGFWTFRLIARKPMLFPVESAKFPVPKKGKGYTLIKGKYIKGLQMQVRDCYIIEAIPKVQYVYSKKILLIDSATYISNGNFFDKQGKLWIGYHTVIAPYRDPCGNSFRALAYDIFNYETGSETATGVFYYASNSSDTKLDDFTLRNISSLSR